MASSNILIYSDFSHESKLIFYFCLAIILLDIVGSKTNYSAHSFPWSLELSDS